MRGCGPMASLCVGGCQTRWEGTLQPNEETLGSNGGTLRPNQRSLGSLGPNRNQERQGPLYALTIRVR